MKIKSANPPRLLKTVVLASSVLAACFSGATYAESIAETLTTSERNSFFSNEIDDRIVQVVRPVDDCANSASNPIACAQMIEDALIAASNFTGGNRNPGGVVRLRRGTYHLTEIQFPSNVRLEIDAGTEIMMESVTLFSIGRSNDAGNSDRIENVEITVFGNRVSGDDNRRYTIFANTNRPAIDRRFVRIGNAENFAISNMNQIDNFTLTPNIFLVADSDRRSGVLSVQQQDNRSTPFFDPRLRYNPTYRDQPNRGVIKHINGENIATGFAVVQPFSGTNLLIEDIEGTRGISVRIEPGSGIQTADQLNRAGPRFGAMRNITLRNIKNTGGFASVFLRPHSKIIENVTIEGPLEGVNTTFVVFVESGNAPVRSRAGDEGYTRGYFTSTTISGDVIHRVTDTNFMSDITFAGSFLLPRDGGIRSDVADENGDFTFRQLPLDGSGLRRVGQPILPIALLSAFSETELGNDEAGEGRLNQPGATPPIPDNRPNSQVRANIGYNSEINPPMFANGEDLDEGSSARDRNRFRAFGGRFRIDISNTNITSPGLNTAHYNNIGLIAGAVRRPTGGSNRGIAYREDLVTGSNEAGTLRTAQGFIKE